MALAAGSECRPFEIELRRNRSRKVGISDNWCSAQADFETLFSANLTLISAR